MIEPGDGDYLKVTLRFPKVEAWPVARPRAPGVRPGRRSGGDRSASVRGSDLAPLVAARPGSARAGRVDGFELAVRAVLGQQITVQAARLLAGKITAEHGARLQDEAANGLGLTHFFPSRELWRWLTSKR